MNLRRCLYDGDQDAYQHTDHQHWTCQLDNQYEQLVYSEYLDLETVEEIAGVSFNDEASKENTDATEKPETKEGSDAGDKPNDSSDLENKPEDNNGSGNVSGRL